MHIEGSRASRAWAGADTEQLQASNIDSYKEEIKSLQMEIERLKLGTSTPTSAVEPINRENEDALTDEVVEIHEDKVVTSYPEDFASGTPDNEDAKCPTVENDTIVPKDDAHQPLVSSFNGSAAIENNGSVNKHDSVHPLEHKGQVDSLKEVSVKMV